MSNNSISMNKIRQVLRCYASGNGTKSLSSMLSISRFIWPYPVPWNTWNTKPVIKCTLTMSATNSL